MAFVASRALLQKAAVVQPLVKLSPKLAQVLGASELTRPQVTKKIWEVIKAGGMQDAAVKSKINLSGPLREALGCEATIKHTDILKVLQPHLTKKA